MPPNDDAARPVRRSLGRGPGASTAGRGPSGSGAEPPHPPHAVHGPAELRPGTQAPRTDTPGTGTPDRNASRPEAADAETGDSGVPAAEDAPGIDVRGAEAPGTAAGCDGPGSEFPGAETCVARAPGTRARDAGGAGIPDGEAPAADTDAPGAEMQEASGLEGAGAEACGTGVGGTESAGTVGGEVRATGAGGGGRFTLRLDNFEGPFDLLLQLISRHKLDVTEVALSQVTDEFMAYIRAMGPDWDLDQTTEFLVVAATLLDLKAARLLPAAEVEDEADLALLEARDLLFARLLQYRAYKRIAEIFELRVEDEGKRYPRTVGLEPHHAELLPEVVISIGAEGFARLAVQAMRPRAAPEVYVDHIHAPLVSVREQAGLVVRVLKARGEATFQDLTEDAPDTLTVVARFLALLELYREKAVVLDQEEALGTLTVRWTGGDGDGMPTVTDEFDRIVEVSE
ncbi:segregation/condensation protein A [Streptomyces sp. NPDC003042]